MSEDIEQALKARRDVDAPEKARFWIKRRVERLQSRSLAQNTLSNTSEARPKKCSKKMALPIGILLCLVITSMGLTVYAIAAEEPLGNESNDMESTIKSRSDYPDYDDLSSFFDFEIGPPSITYQDAAEMKAKKALRARQNANKNYYYYHSEGYPTMIKKQVVTPGTHYKPSTTENTFIEGEEKSNESTPIVNQAKVGAYQVSIVDADSPIFSKLGLTPEDLARLSAYDKKVINTSMLASDSTSSATYAQNPRPDYSNSPYPPSNSHDAPSYQPGHEASKYPPPMNGYTERQSTSNNRYPPSETSHSRYNQPPPQGSYDAKSYKAVQDGYSQGSNGYNYAPRHYNHPPSSPNTYSNPPHTSSSYNNPHSAPSYNNPNNPAPYNNPNPAPYHNPNPAPYNHPPTHSAPPRPSSSYDPHRSSEVPWRPSPQHHTDWDDKQTKKDWQSGPYPLHPAPLPYSSTSSSTGYKPHYEEKTGHHLASSYKPESSSKPVYSNSHSSGEYSSHKPYYSSSGYSSSSKIPSRQGSVSIAASSSHHEAAPSKPGITIRFKARSPSHGHSHGHGVDIPLSLSPFEVVKKLLPSLNPLNNKKVTIGITIENKKEHEYHAYRK